jgi:DNA-binding transcriptional ArsR family regulator
MTIESPKPPRPVQQPRVVDVSRPGGAGLTVEIDASEAAELLLSIATVLVAEEHDTYELGAARIEELRAAAPPELLRDADRLLPFKSAGQLLGLVYTTPKPRTAAAFLEHFAATDAVEIRLHLLGYYTRGHRVTEPETLRRAAEGDGDAIGQLLDSYAEYLDADKCSDAEQVLRTDAGEGKQALLELLSAWTEQVLPEIEPADYPSLLERDADAKRELVRSVPPEQVVERLAPGIQWSPGADIDRVVLFPAYSPRPWVYMSEYKRVKIFCPPITVDRERTPGDPAELVRIYKALGDASRLKLLKRLQDGPISLTDAAQEIGLAKSTTHHHLALLRQAGFVLIREGDDTYRLRPDMRPEPGALLQQYLGT